MMGWEKELSEEYTATANGLRIDHINRYPDSVEGVFSRQEKARTSSGLVLVGVLGFVWFMSRRRK